MIEQPSLPRRSIQRPSKKKGYRKTDFYRHSRALHAWLSAFAFLTLMFFSATGILLNHPEWFTATQPEQIQEIALSAEVISTAQQQENPSVLLLDAVREQTALVGRFKSIEIFDDEVMIRLESPAGSTDVVVLWDQAIAEVTQQPATTVTLLNDLHRGKSTGAAWRWLIDISAVLILLLSIAGYVLFFSLKTRKATSLWLTAGSVALMFAVYWISV
ncbi:MAG: PepSY-associated TM helix domain-containing protein [Pseudomonadota bacterium]|nr:PepSY-associated TM helix domain-containing protein [Pseudomonadota bacterium]